MITAIGTRIRRYLYRATTSFKSTKSSRVVLTAQQVRRVLTYLDDELFPQRPDLQRSILQASPRIVSRNV